MKSDQIDIRDAFFDRVCELGRKNSNIIVLSGDLDAFSLQSFSRERPSQYINVGVSEQNMINVAAGLAISGKTVFCYSIASFMTLRCFEQIKVNICSMNLPVVMVGAGTGFSFGFDGPTHHGHLDLSSMRLLPEITVIDLSSTDLASKAVDFATKSNSPTYIRLDKGIFPNWDANQADLCKGFRILKRLHKVNLISNGYMVKEVMKVTEHLNNVGIDCGVVDLFRVKPFPATLYKEVICASDMVVTIEEGCKTGGLGTALSELIAQNEKNCLLRVIAAPDKQFIEYGERDWFHKKYQLDHVHMANAIQNMVV